MTYATMYDMDRVIKSDGLESVVVHEDDWPELLRIARQMREARNCAADRLAQPEKAC